MGTKNHNRANYLIRITSSLPGATVIISPEGKTTNTNELGTFKITITSDNPQVIGVNFIGYEVFKQKLTLGANNLFDIFPDRQIYDNSYFGVFKYASVQMGTLGSYYLLRATLDLPNSKKK